MLATNLDTNIVGGGKFENQNAVLSQIFAQR